MFDLDAFRALRDAYGLERYAESIAAHRARLAALEAPDELRAGYVAQWEKIHVVFANNPEPRDIFLKRLAREARDALALQRALIRHERAEIERVTALYYQLKREINRRKTA